jgi:hypothetical protein
MGERRAEIQKLMRAGPPIIGSPNRKGLKGCGK